MEPKLLTLTQSSLPTPTFNSSSFFPKHSTLLAQTQRWKLNIRRISWKGQAITKKLLLHVDKEGEGEGLSSSISELDLMPIFEIVDDVNVDMEGQHHLHMNIPSAISGFARACHVEGNKLHKIASGFGLHGKQWNQIFTVPAPCQLPLAKTTGSFLVLVPLVAALCIRCVVAAFQNRAARNLRHEAANKCGVHQHGSKRNSMRWKTVLGDLRDPEALSAESEPDSSLLMGDKEPLHFEDMSHAYTKLEDEYQKFLSECGMSKWGYWRGGSSQ